RPTKPLGDSVRKNLKSSLEYQAMTCWDQTPNPFRIAVRQNWRRSPVAGGRSSVMTIGTSTITPSLKNEL
ncbi:hypothetical protein, partial [Neorhizobium huautlense]|uniref:hypothetical protein n=1 Tax=Neorhizobium huautlense TaxID=67774 RepID=UPI0027D803C5